MNSRRFTRSPRGTSAPSAPAFCVPRAERCRSRRAKKQCPVNGCGWPAPPELRDCVYLARLNVTSAVPLPADGVRTVYFMSSPATVIGRFCSVPFQFGNELYSM
jgi:hypothetical protein